MDLPDAPAVRAAVLDLLARAAGRPCAHGAQAFGALVPPPARFAVALRVLLPVADGSAGADDAVRILALFVLCAMYAPHPVEMNPFVDAIRKVGEGGQGPVAKVAERLLHGGGGDIAGERPDVLAREEHEAASSSSQASSNGHSPHPPATAPPNGTAPSLETTARIASLLLDARTRVLTLSEQKFLTTHLHAHITELQAGPAPAHPVLLLSASDLPSLIAHNPALAHLATVALLLAAPSPDAYTAELARLTPTPPALDVLARLLHDGTPPAVAARVRRDVLGAFVAHAIAAIDAGGGADDRAVRSLCRFYAALIRRGAVDARAEAEAAEMAAFALRYAGYADAHALYRLIVAASHGPDVE